MIVGDRRKPKIGKPFIALFKLRTAENITPLPLTFDAYLRIEWRRRHDLAGRRIITVPFSVVILAVAVDRVGSNDIDVTTTIIIVNEVTASSAVIVTDDGRSALFKTDPNASNEEPVMIGYVRCGCVNSDITLPAKNCPILQAEEVSWLFLHKHQTNKEKSDL